VIITPECRLLPEHPSPAAVENCYTANCYTAVKWTFNHVYDLGIDTKEVMLGGLSGGGGIAAVTALMWRDRKAIEIRDEELCGMWLSCPMLDHRGDTRSLLQYADANITALFLAKSWEFALGKDHALKEDVSGYISPAVAKDLSRLPRVFLDVGSEGCLRDEVVRFARRVWEAGTQAEVHVWEGGFHEFDEFAPTGELRV
jgi:acetyl esterase/lipase